MEYILLNYKDIQFILGCSTADAKHIVYKYMEREDKADIISSGSINVNHLVSAERIDICYNSPFEGIHGSKQVYYTINQMREIGISDTMKHEVLEDLTNIIRGGAIQEIRFLKKVTYQRTDKEFRGCLNAQAKTIFIR